MKMLETEHKTKKHEPLPEVMYVDTASPKTRKAKPAKLIPNDADVMVVSLLDIKATRKMILDNWKKYTPEKIVTILREYYTNMRSLAVMLSQLKKDLKRLTDAPPDEFLSEIRLSKKEYNDIRALNNDIRKRGAMSVVVVSNADQLVLQAMQYLVSDSQNLLYAAVFLVSGLRPIELDLKLLLELGGPCIRSQTSPKTRWAVPKY
jgi:hypothetical protein